MHLNIHLLLTGLQTSALEHSVAFTPITDKCTWTFTPTTDKCTWTFSCFHHDYRQVHLNIHLLSLRLQTSAFEHSAAFTMTTDKCTWTFTCFHPDYRQVHLNIQLLGNVIVSSQNTIFRQYIILYHYTTCISVKGVCLGVHRVLETFVMYDTLSLYFYDVAL